MSRNLNYTGRHSKMQRDTGKTPAAKMFGQGKRLSESDKRDIEAARNMKRMGVSGSVFNGKLYPTFGNTVLPGIGIEEYGLDPKTGKPSRAAKKTAKITRDKKTGFLVHEETRKYGMYRMGRHLNGFRVCRFDNPERPFRLVYNWEIKLCRGVTVKELFAFAVEFLKGQPYPSLSSTDGERALELYSAAEEKGLVKLKPVGRRNWELKIMPIS